MWMEHVGVVKMALGGVQAWQEVESKRQLQEKLKEEIKNDIAYAASLEKQAQEAR